MSLLPLALLALAVPLHAGDCVFDGDCAPRPGVVAVHDAAPDAARDWDAEKTLL